MKKIIVFLIFILLLISTVPAFFAGTVALLSADDVKLIEESILVPVKISDNPGIMGFKVKVEYNTDLLLVDRVIQGSVLKKGSFFSNVGLTKGEFEIIWYNTTQVDEDGSLFVLSVSPTSEFEEEGKTEIKLSYSQADTFNQQYDDVQFDCKNISVYYGGDTQKSITVTYADDKADDEPTDIQMISAVNTALKNKEIEKIDEIDDSVVDEVNKNINTILGTNVIYYDTVEEIISKYKEAVKNEYVHQINNNLDQNDVDEIIRGVLDSKNVKSLSDLSDSNKHSVLTEIFDKLKEKDASLPELSGIITNEDAVEVIERLSDDSEDELLNEDVSVNWILVIAIVVASAVITVLLVCFLRKKFFK